MERMSPMAEENIINELTPYDRLEIIRHKNRPTIRDYLPLIFTDFYEMHGDRLFGDDGAILGGVGRFQGMPVTVISEVKGRDIFENKASNFAMPHPEGYRKALRLARQAEKFHRPVICFIDTSGAFCGVAAEKRGQGEAIARNLAEFMTLRTPVISVILGEGGSGGALALGVCDELAMMENAIYSVISPRGFASILWKDGKRAKEASEVMKITAHDLYALNIVEQVIPEYGTADEKACESISRYMKGHMKEFLERQNGKTGEQLAEERYARFRAF